MGDVFWDVSVWHRERMEVIIGVEIVTYVCLNL